MSAVPGTSPGRRQAGLATLLGLLAAAGYAGVGIVRFDVGRAGPLDLGIFSQAAKAWASGHWPGSAIRNQPDLLGDHFSPITVVFGAAWRVWPDPRALVLTQALAMGTAVGLVAWAWLRAVASGWVRLPVAAVVVLVVLVALGKGIVSAAFFDVHETGLGVAAMAVLCLGLLDGRSRLVWAGALALLLVKEDLGATVVAAGAVWFLRTRRRGQALALAAAGVVGVLVAFTVIGLVSGRGSIYLSSLLGGGAPTAGSGFLASTAPLGGSRFAPLLLFAAAAGVVGLRSPLALVAAPTLAWRMVSSNDAYWQTYFHYDVILAPVAALALLDVVRTGTAEERPVLPGGLRRPRVLVPLATAGLVVSAALGVAKLSQVPLLDPASYRPDRQVRALWDLTAVLPDGAPVAAQQDLGVPLISRFDVHMLSDALAVPARYVVLRDDSSIMGAPRDAKRRWLGDVSAQAGVVVRRQATVVLVDLGGTRQVRLPSG